MRCRCRRPSRVADRAERAQREEHHGLVGIADEGQQQVDRGGVGERAEAPRGEGARAGIVRPGGGDEDRAQLRALEAHRDPRRRPPVEARAGAVEEGLRVRRGRPSSGRARRGRGAAPPTSRRGCRGRRPAPSCGRSSSAARPPRGARSRPPSAGRRSSRGLPPPGRAPRRRSPRRRRGAGPPRRARRARPRAKAAIRRTSTSWSFSRSTRAGTSAGSATRPAARAARRLTPRSGSRRSRSSSPAPDERVSSIASRPGQLLDARGRRRRRGLLRGPRGRGGPRQDEGGERAAEAKASHHPPIIASAAPGTRARLASTLGDGDEVDAVREAQTSGLRADPLPRAPLPDRGEVQRPAQKPRLRDRDDRNAVPASPHLARVRLDERAHLVTRGAQGARPGPADRPRSPDDDAPPAREGAPRERLELQREEAPGRVARDPCG